MPMSGTPQFENKLGEVQDTPTQYTLLRRLRNLYTSLTALGVINTAVQTAVQGMQSVVGAVADAASATGTLLARQRYIANAINAVKTATQGMQSNLGAVGAASDVDGVVHGQLRYIGTAVLNLLTGTILAAGTAVIGKIRMVTASGTEVTDDVSDAIKTTIRPMFGPVSLFSQGNGKAQWERSDRVGGLSTDQKSTTGWLAKLIGGAQVGWGSAGALHIAVDELPLASITDMQWTYWMQTAELFGCQVAFWVHDPTDFASRGDIIQSGAAVGLAKVAGWNRHDLNLTTPAQFFYYAENEGTPGLDEGPANLYSLADFQADTVFSSWTIYRISLNNGFYNAGVFGDMFVADVQVNGQMILLKPSEEELLYNEHLVKNDIPISSSIYTPRRIHVTPVFSVYGTEDGQGIGHLVKKANYGLDNQIGYAAMLGSTGAGTNVNTFAIPVNIPLNKIATMSYLEKMKNAALGDTLAVCYFRLDADRSGMYEPHNDTDGDMYLGADQTGFTGNNTWTLINPFASAVYQLVRWHSRIATPDGGITDTDFTNTFAAYQATDIGNYIVKEIGWAYCGPAVGDWGMIVGIVINGVEYILDKPENHIVDEFQTGTGATAIALTVTPMTPFRLLSCILHFAVVPGTTSQDFTITLDAGDAADVYDVVLYANDIKVTASKDIVIPFGIGYEFKANDVVKVAYANADAKTFGVRLTYEVL